MAKNFLDRITLRTRIGFFAAIFLLFISYILTFISTRKVEIQDYWMEHTNEVIHNLDNIMGFISVGESSFRGYLITSDKSLLTKYDESRKKTDSTLSIIGTLTNDNDSQQKNLDSLRSLINEKYTWIRNMIAAPPSAQNMSTLDLNGREEGVANSLAIETMINKMKQQEIDLRNDWSYKISQYSGLIQILNILSIVIAVLLTVYSLVVYNKENKQKNINAKKAEDYKKQLQQRVEELGKVNEELVELRRLEKYAVTGRIARVIAHEVRNPLTNINLACEQLQAEVENEDAEMFFTMIRRNADRINQLVSDLLAATRTELNFSKASINEILDASLDLALDRIKLNQIKVVKKYDDNVCSLPVDIDKIKISFLNIIVNAIEAMDQNGVLEISSSNTDGKCMVQITDNGKGMKKTEVDRLFEPYFTTKEKGNGLGLANSQNIIIGHKGSITAESEYGKGTTFTITFPVSHD
ncbi:MAG: ATP-binding protein [Ginsengibacter sp.]